jgi:putative N6-adenine-specific DNA methylase
MILMAAGYDGSRPLVDPMCGSGTFSLEAAMLAKGMAPGARRRFAFMGWPAFGESQWTYLKQAATAAERQLDRPLIFSSDIDAGACDHLAGQVAANGLSDAVRVVCKDFFSLRAADYGGGPGLVVINPPYGLRLGSPTAADDLFRRIGRHLQRAFEGWNVALIAPERRFLKSVPFPVRQIPIQHGGLTVTLCLGKAVS